MRNRLIISFLVIVLAVGLTAPSSAADLPAGDAAGVDLVATLPAAADATAINFLQYGRGPGSRDVMLVVGQFGLQSYDVSDPAAPVRLDEVSSDALKLPGDTDGTFWQNEDMDVDPARKLVFLARDPRAYDGSTSDPDSVSGVYIIDAADPAGLELLTFHPVPTGHTSTCINDCQFLWTGGPASSTAQQDAWPGGRPIIVTDIRDPENPLTFPDPVDLGRNDGLTAYAHDVQVDDAGIAWVSGLGGVRGYHTRGRHFDPLQGRVREATAWDPVPYAGGGFEPTAAPTNFMHNSYRPTAADLRQASLPSPAYKPGELLLATEEAFGSSTCDGVGVFAIASLTGSYGGEAWRSTPDDPFRLRTVGTWSPHGEEGTITNAFCSAHYFDVADGVVAYSWYAQGTRFLDISDPENPRQIAYYRPDGGVSWAAYHHDGLVYVADNSRGVDILRLNAAAARNRTAGADVHAPAMSAAQHDHIDALAARYRPDPDLGWACPLPAD